MGELDLIFKIDFKKDDLEKSESNSSEKEEKLKDNYVSDPKPDLRIEEPIVYLYNTHQGEQYALSNNQDYNVKPTVMTVLSDVQSCTDEYYQNNIKPKPVPVGETPKGETIWRCTICGYEWVGEELPDDFICPICKHPKTDFEKVVR